MSSALQFLLLLLAVVVVEGPPPPGGDLTTVTDQEIIRALSVLLTQDRRDDLDTAGDGVSFRRREQFDEEERKLMEVVESERQQSLSVLDRQEKCEVTGFETRTREECEEVTEVDCKPITVKKIRTEIRPKCETMLNKTCDVIYNSEPKQQCKPTTSKRCEIDFNIITEQHYREDCSVDVQHICEEHLQLPLPYHHQPSYHPPPPPPQPPALSDGYGIPPPPPPPLSDEYGVPQPHHHIESNHDFQFNPAVERVPLPAGFHQSLQIDPKQFLFTPQPQESQQQAASLAMHSRFLASQEENKHLMARKLFSRNKREAQGREESMEILLKELELKRRKLGLIEEDEQVLIDDIDENKMREIVTIMIQDEIRRKQQENQQKISTEFGVDSLVMETKTMETGSGGASPASQPPLGGRLIPSPADQGLESLTEAIMEEIKRRTENQTQSDSLGDSLTPTQAFLSTPPVIIGVPIETRPSSPDLQLPPQVSVEELPSEPGCRTLATKTCYKTPVIINKKVPFETCRSVPDVECHTILRPVPDIECVPEPYIECNDIAVDIPFLEPAEECEEIVFDDCVEIQEKIPVELCSRKRVDEESFFLERGKVFRKEGEKRRRKVGKKKDKQEDEKEKEEL